ncbi:MAG: hypothetical protein LBC42_01445 [Puniceicoccales bacterium]|nr:hypothetical protein [Puniceicoccales bacterium]
MSALCSGVFGVSGYLSSGVVIAACGAAGGFFAGIAIYSLFYLIFGGNDSEDDETQPDWNTVVNEGVGTSRRLGMQ